jgi:hypothetical protein
MAKAGKKLKQKKPAVNATTGANDEHDGIEVASDADLPKMSALLERNPIVLGIIVMDGCHYCETLKPILEKYKQAQGRKIPLLKVNRTMVEKTPFNSAKIDGYPSGVVYSPQDGSFGSFKKEDGGETHAIPNLRDEASMIKLLQSDPKALQKIAISPNSENSESLHATPRAERLLEASGKQAIKEKNRPLVDMNSPLPPNTSSDKMNESSERPSRVASGGSLLGKIMRYVEELIPSPAEPVATTRRQRRKRQRNTTRKG